MTAEDPVSFTPSPGRITAYVPPGGPGVRVDSHCFAGYIVPPHYDSLVAKVITHGANRAEALARMRRALARVPRGGDQDDASPPRAPSGGSAVRRPATTRRPSSNRGSDRPHGPADAAADAGARLLAGSRRARRAGRSFRPRAGAPSGSPRRARSRPIGRPTGRRSGKAPSWRSSSSSGPLERMGFRVELVSFDDQARPDVGVANAKNIVADREILAVVGHLDAGVGDSRVGDLQGRAPWPGDRPAGTGTLLTDRSLPSVSRVCGRDDVQGVVAAGFAAATLMVKSVYVLHDGTTPGQDVAELFRAEAERRGLRVLGFDGMRRAADIDPLVGALTARSPDSSSSAGAPTRRRRSGGGRASRGSRRASSARTGWTPRPSPRRRAPRPSALHYTATAGLPPAWPGAPPVRRGLPAAVRPSAGLPTRPRPTTRRRSRSGRSRASRAAARRPRGGGARPSGGRSTRA